MFAGLKDCPIHHISQCITAMDSVCSPPLSVALLTESLFGFLFLRVLRYFNSASLTLSSEQFRYLWIFGCLLLPTAFRSLPRLSSLSKPNYPLNGLLVALLLRNCLPIQLHARSDSLTRKGPYLISAIISESSLLGVCSKTNFYFCSRKILNFYGHIFYFLKWTRRDFHKAIFYFKKCSFRTRGLVLAKHARFSESIN